MTMQDDDTPQDLDRFTRNLERVDELTRRLMRVFTQARPANPQLSGPDNQLFTRAATAYWQGMMQDPQRMLEHQVEFWGKSVKHYVEAQKMMAQGRLEAPEDPGPADARFANPLWQTHPYFNYIKRQYLTNAETMRQAVADIDDMDPTEKRRLDHFSRQIVDMMAPTNFLGTNPDALERAVETEGDSLVAGLENLIADLEANEGELVVRLADETAFQLGENIATAPGQVVFRNRMMELIQYETQTEKVHATPLVIFPPWINKFYILDLKEKNSLIRWITEQGYTLFVVSWVNPDASYAETGMEDYVRDGYLEAIDRVKAITGEDRINVVGYCIAGTTLALTLSLLKKRGDKSVKSATFFTALTDFSDQGEFTPYLQDDFIDGIEAEIDERGILRSSIMARTFSFLRANDLVYGPAIRSYMMGQTPPAFDLLYWNGDGSSLPGRMARQYLRGLCQENRLAKGTFELMGERLDLGDVDVPLISITCETDHIAAARDCYRGVQQMGGRSKTFLLSQSGHIAGIVNPPSKKKYGHYTNDDLTLDWDDWRAGAEFHEGSWWPRWESWLKKRSGKLIPAREVGDSDHPPLCPAPGTYVAAKSRL